MAAAVVTQHKNFSGRSLSRKLKKNNGSMTPGKTKGASCKATPLARYMCRRNRSYKHKMYPVWYVQKNGEKVVSEGPSE